MVVSRYNIIATTWTMELPTDLSSYLKDSEQHFVHFKRESCADA